MMLASYQNYFRNTFEYEFCKKNIFVRMFMYHPVSIPIQNVTFNNI